MGLWPLLLKKVINNFLYPVIRLVGNRENVRSVAAVDVERVFLFGAGEPFNHPVPEAELAILAQVDDPDLAEIAVPEQQDHVERITHKDALRGEKNVLRKITRRRSVTGEIDDGDCAVRLADMPGDDALRMEREIGSGKAAGRFVKRLAKIARRHFSGLCGRKGVFHEPIDRVCQMLR